MRLQAQESPGRQKLQEARKGSSPKGSKETAAC